MLCLEMWFWRWNTPTGQASPAKNWHALTAWAIAPDRTCIIIWHITARTGHRSSVDPNKIRWRSPLWSTAEWTQLSWEIVTYLRTSDLLFKRLLRLPAFVLSIPAPTKIDHFRLIHPYSASHNCTSRHGLSVHVHSMIEHSYHFAINIR